MGADAFHSYWFIKASPTALLGQIFTQESVSCSPQTSPTFLSLFVVPMTTAMVAGADSRPLTHSTRGMMCAGEKKCIPITCSGL